MNVNIISWELFSLTKNEKYSFSYLSITFYSNNKVTNETVF